MISRKEIINIIILSIIVILIYCLLKYLNNRNKIIIDSTGFLEKNILSKKECNKLINLSKKYTFTTDEEPVDGKPVYQIDIITSKNKIDNPNLWKEIQPIYEEKLIPIMKHIPWLSTLNYTLDFVFLKRYRPDERTYLGLHTDDNFFTIAILLSSINDFSGGELYIFNTSKTTQYMKIYEDMDNTEKDQFIKNYKKLPVINYNQGDMVAYTGDTHLHGTLPVTQGERYVLIFFFDKL